jgi:hypothetical protein
MTIIDISTIIQVFATVLVGVLIFLTLERRFEHKEDYDKNLDRLWKKRDSLFEKMF